MKKATILLFLSGFLYGCFGDDAAKLVRVACGFADVLLKEVDLIKVDNAFSAADSSGAKVCRAVRAYAQVLSDESTPSPGRTDFLINLPSGGSVPVSIEFKE